MRSLFSRQFSPIGLTVLFGVLSNPVVAQIIPDSTLPIPSIVTPSDSTLTIDGGTPVGGNLFHSFQEFSVPTGAEAFFNNAPLVDNIITRVTGGIFSHIDGLIRANGTADLFLINPSGIVFGANAKLDIGGSFIGSTANSIQFDDDNLFSATNPNTPPLLTVSVPIGLQFNTLPSPMTGEIRVEGLGHGIDQPNLQPSNLGDVRGLQVPTGNTLALVGGNIIFEGGVLTAEAGRIELGSVADGAVSLIPASTGWTLGYDGASNFRDITLLSQSAVDASGNPGGSIQIQGRNLELRDGSVALIQNQGDRRAGDILVNLSESLIAAGIDPDGTPPSRLTGETVGAGDTGAVQISARNLFLLEGGQINTVSYSSAATGNITLKIADSTLLSGFTLDATRNPFISNILAISINSGDAGDINLSTRQLSIQNGGLLSSTILAFGKATGNGGDVLVNASESVEITGFNPNFSGSSLSASTFNNGNAGNVMVNTARLTLRDGGRVDANTIASGDAGSVTINASEFVDLSGVVTAPEVTTPTQIGSAANLPDPALRQFLGLDIVPSGSPGNVTINTPELRVRDGAVVTVTNEGTGDAGNLSIQADSIFLDNGGGITASTDSGEGGNLTLHIGNTLQLRNGSQITSEAGGTGNGGNIALEANTLALLEGSRITANAFEGAGGNIQIETQGIFTSADSAITASSQLGVDGVVQINNPGVDPSSGLVELSSETTDADDRITSGCGATEGNSFTITGRGGLPEDPTATIQNQTVWEDLRNFSVDPEFTGASVSQPQPAELQARRELVEATGWIVREDGVVELVASGEMASPSWTRVSQCRQ